MDNLNRSRKITTLFFAILSITLATFVLPRFGEALASQSVLVPSGFFPLVIHESGIPGAGTSTPTATITPTVTATRAPTPTRTSTPTTGGNKVLIVDMAFLPAEITVHVGETVEWENQDLVSHTTTSDTGVWDSGVLDPDEKFSFVFNSVGDFPYHCSFHPEMTGVVHVIPNP